jgi:hypothetical protein
MRRPMWWWRRTAISLSPGGHSGPAPGNDRISKFSKDGKFLKSWGKRGSGPGEFQSPHTIALDSQGRLFVGDRSNNRIQIFDQEGRYLDTWTQFGRPSGIARMALVVRHPYLEHERCLPAVVLSSWSFAGRVRMDAIGNDVFPHFDREGLCGYEIKNTGFTGFAAGGAKGLWFSHTGPDDRRLVLTESAIDALSHATLFPDAADQTRYASLGGQPNSQQPGLVKATIARLPEGSEIVAAFDADGAGRRLVDVLRLAVTAVATETGRTDLILNIHLPPQEGQDWNQVLQEHSQRKEKPPGTGVPISGSSCIGNDS